jgi:dimethylaniline monooxygenase (N-oxide forming)
MLKTRTLPQRTEAPPMEFQETVPHTPDPYWNYVHRVALMYSVPVLAFAYCLHRGWVSMSRDFWVPLIFAFLILAPATRLRNGRPFAYTDFRYRNRFLASYALLPASVWCLMVNFIASPAAAALAFCLIMVAYDAVLIRLELLCVFALRPQIQALGVPAILQRFSLPLWGYLALALSGVHAWGADTPLRIAADSLLSALPVVLFWLYWRKQLAPPEAFPKIRRVAVIGAGWSGIYAVKSLTEAGLDVTCFESTDSVGGIWQYRPDRSGGVCESTRVTSSKHFLHPSDFPFDPSSSEFPHHTQIVAHLHNYVDHFGIRDRFQLKTRVVAVEKESAGWRVAVQDRQGEMQEETFDAVVVSSGPHQNSNVDKNHPLYGRFTGRLMHSADYKTRSDIRPGETVLIVGAGESSADIVVESVREGASVHWASRSGQWFADRNMGPFPADHITTQGTRVFAGLFGFWEYLVRRFVTGAFVNLAWGRGGHGIPEWLPDTPYLHQFLNKSRDGVLDVYSGRVIPHRGPVRIVGKQVYFAGEENPVTVDTIILSTGYRPVWPFLAKQPTSLFKLVFDPEVPTLAFVGFARPIVGSIPSLSELQSRWVAKVWSGAAELPARQRRVTEMQLDVRHHARLFRDASQLGMLVDQEIYATEIASLFNAHVHWFKLLFTWPHAFLVMLASPWAPFKYWLNDPSPRRRREALANTIRELPSPRAPNYLLGMGVIAAACVFLGVAAFVYNSLHGGAPGIAGLAVLGLTAACGNRFTERERKRWRDGRSKLRETIPF